MHAEHPFSARPRSTAIACMQGIHTTPSIPVQHPWEKKLDVRPAPSHQSAAVLFQPWDADVAVQHTPRHVLLELRPFRRVSTEEALQHQTTLVLKGSLDLMGTNGIVEIPAAHMPPLSRLATDTVDEADPVICAPRHPRSLTRNGGNWSNPKQATQMDVRDVVGQENPQLVPTTQFWFVGGHCVPGGRGRHTCPAHCADGRTQEPAPRIKRDRPSAGAFVPSFRPSFGNLPGPAWQPWHRVACQGCCQRIIRRKRLAVLIDQSPVAAASQPPYLSCPSSPPIRPIHGEPLGDASQNIRGLRLGQPGGIPMPRGHGDGTHQPGRRARLRPPHSAVGWHPRDGPRVLPRSRSTTSCHPSPTEVADHILGVLYDCGSGPEQRLYIQETLNGGDPLEMKSSRRASTAPCHDQLP